MAFNILGRNALAQNVFPCFINLGLFNLRIGGMYSSALTLLLTWLLNKMADGRNNEIEFTMAPLFIDLFLYNNAWNAGITNNILADTRTIKQDVSRCYGYCISNHYQIHVFVDSQPTDSFSSFFERLAD